MFTVNIDQQAIDEYNAEKEAARREALTKGPLAIIEWMRIYEPREYNELVNPTPTTTTSPPPSQGSTTRISLGYDPEGYEIFADMPNSEEETPLRQLGDRARDDVVSGGGASVSEQRGSVGQIVDSNIPQEGGAQEGSADVPVEIIDPIDPNEDKTDDERFSRDSLSVEERVIKNGEFILEPRKSISDDRPEIISVLNYKPIWSGDPKERNLSKFGRLVEIQHQASYLRRDLLQEVLLDVGLQAQLARAQDDVGRGQFVNIFADLKQSAGVFIEDSRKVIDQLRVMTARINRVQEKFDLKRIPSRLFENNQYYSLKEYYTTYMGYTEKQFERFSNTKIYFQFLRDFRRISQTYSYNLLDLTDEDRAVDKSPVDIDTTFTLSDGFDFRISQLRSKTSTRNMTRSKHFNRFIDSLPGEPGDRIKLLITVLSKEYRVSKALGSDDQAMKVLTKGFDYDPNNPDPFDNVIGNTGRNIFDPPKGVSVKSLMNLGQIVSGKSPLGVQEYDYIVLPFEEKYVDSVPTPEKKYSDDGDGLREIDVERSFVPGKSYFVDSMLDLKTVKDSTGQKQTTFNTTPLQKHADVFAKKQSQAQLVIESLFSLNKVSALGPHATYNYYAKSVKDSYGELIDKATASEEQAVLAAVFKYSNQDTLLKRLLFQFLLLAGLETNRQHSENVIWADLAREFETIKAFGSIQDDEVERAGGTSNVDLLEGSGQLSPARVTVKPYMKMIANKIQRRIKNATETFQNPVKRIDRFYKTIGKNTIRNVLMNASMSTSPNLVKTFLNVVAVYTWGATVDGEQIHLLEDESGRTRYNFMSTSTQLLLIFEILCDFVEISTPSQFIAGGWFVGKRRDLGYEVRWQAAKRVRYALTDTLTQNIINPMQWLSISPQQVEALKKLEEKALEARSAEEGEINYRTDLKAQLYRNTFINIRDKVMQEDSIIANALFVMGIMTKRLQAAKTISEEHFNADSYQIMSEAFRRVRVTKPEDIQDKLFMVREKSQLRTCTYISDQFNRKITDAADFKNQNKVKILSNQGGRRDDTVVTTELVHKNVKEATYAYLSRKKFRRGSFIPPRLRIFSVGIPAGFAEKLVHRVEFTKMGQKAFMEKQTDVVTVRVFKKDLRREDIIFKPQEFIFDMSLYQRDKELIKTNIEAGSSFSKYRAANQLVDYEDIKNKVYYALNPKRAGAGQPFLEEDKYRFLSEEEKKEVFTNHMASHLLGTFVGLATGLRINEVAYNTKNSKIGAAVEQDFEALFLTYIKRRFGVKLPEGRTIQELLVHKKVPNYIKNYLRMIDSAGLVFSLEKIRRNVLDPKLFDRVFHVAVDSDDYEIDVKKTRDQKENPGGRKALKQATVNKKIIVKKDGGREKHFFKPRSKENILFEEYFVTVKNKR